ncbi:MAG: diaminopimelate epimerase [Gammaproteobacteria bacterium]|nr:MAG: diaminopimelate epimerase [Gammaproteobacteria bacterium]
MNKIKFSKMHGLGNDFMVVDATAEAFSLTAQQINYLGNRKTGVGFDQLLVVEPADTAGVDFNYRIFNTDGSEVEHCGNGARCFAKFVKDKGISNKKQLIVKVKKGLISIRYQDDDHIEVDMGQPVLTPSEVPFMYSPDVYQNRYELVLGKDKLPASVLSMGNPHVIFFVSNLWQLSLTELGTIIQQSSYFPQSVNVNFVEIIDKSHIELRTYERGVGETDACGTGACASAFAAAEIGAAKLPISVKMRGGELAIHIDEKQHLFMTGPARWAFDAEITY